MTKIIFTETSFSQYTEWLLIDKKIISKINDLLKSIKRDGVMQGLGIVKAIMNMVREEMKKWTDDLSFRLSFAETNEEKNEPK